MALKTQARFIILAGCMLFLLSGTSFATVSYSDPAQVGQQTNCSPCDLGLEFTVNAAITILDLGVFNGNNTGSISANGNLEVAIFNDASPATPVIEENFVNGGGYTLIGGDLFQAASITLGPGLYTVVAGGFSANDPNGNNTSGFTNTPSTLNTAGGLITFDESSYDFNYTFDGNAVDDSTTAPGNTILGSNPNAFNAGTFEFQAAVAPEPGTLAMFGLGIGLLAMLRRKRSV